MNTRTNVLTNSKLAEAEVDLKAASEKLRSRDDLDRTDIGDIRQCVSAALCKINAVEREMVGVPRPKSGE